MRTIRHMLLATTVIAGALATAPAFAQAPVGSAAPVAAADNEDAGTIIVTGSRIARPDLEQSSPIAVLGSAEIAAKGQINIENVLNDLPQVIGATTGTSNNPGGGIATVNLRGLGTARTLVLVDGRRYVSYSSSSSSQVVDLNTVPSALIERVDVVTGGRSAVYGSDAIAGVVNFVMKRNFAGVEANASYELSSRGDGARRDGNIALGANFDGGKGNVIAFVDVFSRDPIFAFQRPATAFSYTDNGDGTLNPRGGSSSIPSFRAVIPGVNGGNAVRFDANGNAVPYSATNDLYNFGAVNYLQVPQERVLLYAKGRYEINEHFQPYVEAQFINNTVLNQLAPTPVGNTTAYRTGALGNQLVLQVNSPFLSTSAQTQLRAADTDGDGYVNVSAFGRRFIETGPRISNDDRYAYRFVVGMNGDITGDWKYDGYYQYSKHKDAQTQFGNIGITALLNSVRTAFQNPATGAISPFPIVGLANGGTLVCADAGARTSGCVPSNIFGEGKVSDAAVKYISIGAQNQATSSTEVASFAITNSNLFDIGAGPIGVAFGVEHRKETAQFSPDTYLSSGDVAGFNANKPSIGSYNLTEFFGEVNIPLLANRPFFEKLEVNGAARSSKYSNATGNVFTWSAGAQWRPIHDITFRGQYQRAIRGPNVIELFQGTGNNFAGATDPCALNSTQSNATLKALCIQTGVPAAVYAVPGQTQKYGSGGTSFLTFTGGNANLKAERSNTFTVGAVFTPSFLPNASLTVDYYNISITNYIGTVGTQNIVNACYTGATQYCGQLQRAGNGEFQTFIDTNVNVAALKTRGIDVSARIAFPLDFNVFGSEGSKISFIYGGTILDRFSYTPIVGLPTIIECAGKFGKLCSQNVTSGVVPKYKQTVRGTFNAGPFDLSLAWRYTSAVGDDDPATLYGLERINAVSYFDLSTGFRITDAFSLRASVVNLFDKGFQPGASTQQGGNVEQSNTYPESYDVLGRFFSIAGKLRF